MAAGDRAPARVSRVVTMIDAGKILNPRAGRNQIEGAVVDVGMALFEHTIYAPRTGAPANNNLADYVIAVHADAPKLDVTFLDHPDTIFNELGARHRGDRTGRTGGHRGGNHGRGVSRDGQARAQAAGDDRGPALNVR